MNFQAIDSLAGVRTTLNYLKPGRDKPYNYTYQPPGDIGRSSGEVNSVNDILIRDARPLGDSFSLDEQGFKLHVHHSAVSNFYDLEELRYVYYPEVTDLIARVTGAAKVVIFDHTIRSVPKVRAGEQGYREPVQRVHNDYTAASGRRRVSDHLDPDEARLRLKYRFAEINVWRPIKGPLEDAPLAVCDARTIAERDFIATDLIYPDKVGETYSFAYNPSHRWFYFPKMLRHETLLIKCFDSADDGRARFTAHTAFEDPVTPLDAFPRESIEVRALVFFPPD